MVPGSSISGINQNVFPLQNQSLSKHDIISSLREAFTFGGSAGSNLIQSIDLIAQDLEDANLINVNILRKLVANALTYLSEYKDVDQTEAAAYGESVASLIQDLKSNDILNEQVLDLMTPYHLDDVLDIVLGWQNFSQSISEQELADIFKQDSITVPGERYLINGNFQDDIYSAIRNHPGAEPHPTYRDAHILPAPLIMDLELAHNRNTQTQIQIRNTTNLTYTGENSERIHQIAQFFGALQETSIEFDAQKQNAILSHVKHFDLQEDITFIEKLFQSDILTDDQFLKIICTPNSKIGEDDRFNILLDFMDHLAEKGTISSEKLEQLKNQEWGEEDTLTGVKAFLGAMYTEQCLDLEHIRILVDDNYRLGYIGMVFSNEDGYLWTESVRDIFENRAVLHGIVEYIERNVSIHQMDEGLLEDLFDLCSEESRNGNEVAIQRDIDALREHINQEFQLEGDAIEGMNGAQSTHNVNVEAVTSAVAMALADRYDEILKDPAVLNQKILDMHDKIRELPSAPIDPNAAEISQEMKNGAAQSYFKRLQERDRYGEAFKDYHSQLSLKAVIGLAQCAIEEKDTAIFFPITAQDPFLSKIVDAAYQCQRGDNLKIIMEEGVKRTIDDKDPVDKIICKGGQFNKFIDVLMGDHIDANPALLEEESRKSYSFAEVQDMLQQAILTVAQNYLDQNPGEYEAMRESGDDNVSTIWEIIKEDVDLRKVKEAYALVDFEKVKEAYTLDRNDPGTLISNVPDNFDAFYAEYVKQVCKWLPLPEQPESLKRQTQDNGQGSSKRVRRDPTPPPPDFV